MDQESFAAIEEAETKKVAVNETNQRAKDDVDHAEACSALLGHHLRAERRVAVGVLDEAFQVRVGMVNEITFEQAGLDGHLHVLMHGPQLEFRRTPADESYLAVRILSSAPHPAFEVHVASRHPVTGKFRRRFC